jgi:hypothetical protein
MKAKFYKWIRWQKNFNVAHFKIFISKINIIHVPFIKNDDFNELYLWLVHVFQEPYIPISWRYSNSLYILKHYYILSLGDPFAQCQRAMNIHVNGNVFTYIIYVAYVFVNCSHHYLSLKAQLPYPKWVSTIKKCNTSYFRSLMSKI